MKSMAAVFECDSCDYEVDGYTKKELLDEGWKWMEAKKGREFVLCSDCVRHYEKRWTR